LSNSWTESLKAIFKNKGFDANDIDQHEQLITQTALKLQQAVNTGIKQNIDYNPSPEFIAKLYNDVWIFSGCKTYIELTEVAKLLKTETGELKPFYKFRDDVLNIYKTYNINYLKAEYQHAVTSSQMAAKWKQFEQNADNYYLQYRTAGDKRVRASHAALNRITLPSNDPFWDSFYVPNGWNCRCNVIQVLKSRYQPTLQADAMQAGEEALTVRNADGSINTKATQRNQIFKFNPGKQQAVFPQHHPYYQYQRLIDDKLKPIIRRQRIKKWEQTYNQKWNDTFTLANDIDIPENLNFDQKIQHIAKNIVSLQNEIAFVLNKNGDLIARFTGNDENIENISKGLNLTDLIVIHNHPDNSFFSRWDIETTIEKNILSQIVVTNQNLYILTRKSDQWDYDEYFDTLMQLRDNILDEWVKSTTNMFMDEYFESIIVKYIINQLNYNLKTVQL
jgi:SPP1 gp7 family putative phage head morphogenesis protein